MKRFTRMVAVLAVAALVTAACGGDAGDGDGDGGPGGEPQAGGTLKMALLSDVSAAFDPQKEYYNIAWSFFRCCLLRNLLSYNGLDSQQGGDDLHPDLATDLPEISEDGTTYTFTLKEGINYAPPFQDTEIVAQDFIRALEREGTPDAATGGYAFYYSIIEGFDDYSDGKADTISGLTAVDDYTLEIQLSKPSGDLPFLMAMGATSPIPEGAADGHLRDYGRFLVASGPYMFEGSEDLDFSLPPKDQKPASGYKPGKSIVLVRNPSWDPDTDELRPAYVDRIEVKIGGTEEDLANQVDANELDLDFDGVSPAQQLRQYQTDPNLKDQVHINQSDAVRYIELNVAEPPFDDIAVRKAVNFALDKEGMRRVRGGPAFGDIANHIINDALTGNELTEYAPYPSPNNQGDLDAAKEAMKESKYDSDGDGVCDAPECKDILAVTDEADPYPDQAALIQDSFKGLGLTFDIKSFERTTMYEKCLDPAVHTAICLAPAWGKDFSDATTFAEPLFGDTAIGPDSCCNRALVGASPELLKKFDYEVTEVPSADDFIDRCNEIPIGDERVSCWIEFDQFLMEEVVPWIPYLFDNNVDIVSERISHYEFDQFSGNMSLDHVALRPGSD